MTGAVPLLLAWGTLVGLDLVSAPQALLARPLVAGVGAGLLAGDLPAGMQVGLVLELFALDVLPVGAARYPDFGAGTVAAVVLSAGRPWQSSLGLAVLFALGFATLGGWTLQWLRGANNRAVQRSTAGLAAGDGGTVRALQYRGLLLDTLRSAGLAALALGAAWLLGPRLPTGGRFALVTAVAIGAALSAATVGAIRSAGRGARLRWLVAGTGIGLLGAALR